MFLVMCQFKSTNGHNVQLCCVYVMSREFGSESESKDCLFCAPSKKNSWPFLLFSNTSIIVDLVSSLKRRTYCRHQKKEAIDKPRAVARSENPGGGLVLLWWA